MKTRKGRRRLPVGSVRIRHVSSAPHPLVAPQDLRIEALQKNGAWVALRGVCAATVSLSPDHFASVRVEIEIVDINVTVHARNVRKRTRR